MAVNRERAVMKRAALAIEELQVTSLHDVRSGADLSQTEVAERIGVSQAAVNETERRTDLMVSTLRRYLEANGADVWIVVRGADGTVGTLDLGSAPSRRSQTRLARKPKQRRVVKVK